jgi:hypothetical protein
MRMSGELIPLSSGPPARRWGRATLTS